MAHLARIVISVFEEIRLKIPINFANMSRQTKRNYLILCLKKNDEINNSSSKWLDNVIL